MGGGPFVVSCSSQTCHEGFVEVAPLDQQRALYTPLRRSRGADTDDAETQCSPNIRKSPADFFVKFTKI